MKESTSEAKEMGQELYDAIVKGDLNFFKENAHSDEILLSKSYGVNNGIHIAALHENYNIVEMYLKKFPTNKIICEGNSQGNTPLHIAAQVGDTKTVNLLFKYLEKWTVFNGEEKPPWKLQNLEGNTPVHVAIIHHNLRIAKFLLQKDISLATILNESGEAPLHLAVKHYVEYDKCKSIAKKLEELNGKQIETHLEGSSSVIEYLVKNMSCVASWCDKNGLTPLHRATLLDQPAEIVEVTRLIIKHFPQSAHKFDALGNSILHLLVSKNITYRKLKNLLKFKEIYTLRNHKNKQGNTPLHVAVINKDNSMIGALLDTSIALSIKNEEGISVASLFQQVKLDEIMKRTMTSKETEAARKGDVEYFNERMKHSQKELLLARDSQGRNIIHNLMQIENDSQIVHEGFVELIRKILERSRALGTQTDLNGDTPVHVLVRNAQNSTLGKSGLLPRLLELYNVYNKEEEVQSPWLMQNGKGNTPLHEAILAHNDRLVQQLLGYDKAAATKVNECGEVPLHLIAKFRNNCMVKCIAPLLQANGEAANWADKEGLTPLLRACHKNSSVLTAQVMAKELCDRSSEATAACDSNGQTFWHLLVTYSPYNELGPFLAHKNLRRLLTKPDKGGDTALHLAIKSKRFDFVRCLIDDERLKSESYRHWLVELFEQPNKADVTSAELIGELQSLPSGIEEAIMHKKELIGIRSIWGRPTADVNTIGIIAALLATITFTAGYAVPGGLNEDLGTPVLIGNAAFQVFMIGDVVAMCLSMMVLFCLLWIMATGNKQTSTMLLDCSLSLLLLSFYATVVTFIAGLFATLFAAQPWMAFLTLVLCFLIMVFLHGIIIIYFRIPNFIRATFIFIHIILDSILCRRTINKRSIELNDERADNQTLKDNYGDCNNDIV